MRAEDWDAVVRAAGGKKNAVRTETLFSRRRPGKRS
jgi:hypothetical protein